MEWREFKMLYSSYNPIKYYPSNFTRKRPDSKEYNILAKKIKEVKNQKKKPKNKQIVGQYSYLSCCVDNLSGIFLALVLDNPRKRVLDRRVIRLDKVILDKLYRERRLACRNFDWSANLPPGHPSFFCFQTGEHKEHG